MTTKFLMTAAAAVVMVSVSSPSWALFGDDEARKAILELREKTQTLQNAQMQLVGQIEALREQNAQLTGRVEKLTNDLTLQQRSVRDLFGNLDKRVAALEPQMESIDGKNEMVSPEERRRYDLALALFSEGRYAESETLLKSLLADYPKGGYTASALCWLGNALYAQGSYTESLKTQQRVVKEFPQDARAAEAKLSMASSYTALNRKKEAVDMLQSIVKQYPGTQASDIARERLKGLGVKASAKKR